MFTPTWSAFKITTSAEYLGFLLGPGSLGRQWENPIKKAMDNALKWRSVKAGFFYNILAVNIYILSLFTFIGQLAKPDLHVDECFAYIRSHLFSGPGNWIPQSFLENLKELGFPTQIRDMKAAFLASRIRVALTSTLPLTDLITETGTAITAFRAKYCNSPHPHSEWHNNTFLFNVTLAQQLFYDGDYDRSEVNAILQKTEEKKRNLQKAIQASIMEKTDGDKLTVVLDKFRIRLERWKMVDIQPGHRVPRARRRLLHLKKHAQPAVVSAYFKTLLNGWPTQRRMAHLANANTPTKCVFCNQRTDCIEHFPFCDPIRSLYNRHGIRCNDLSQFLGLDMRSFPQHTVMIAKLQRILFRARQQFVHALQSSSPLPNAASLIRSAEIELLRHG